MCIHFDINSPFGRNTHALTPSNLHQYLCVNCKMSDNKTPNVPLTQSRFMRRTHTHIHTWCTGEKGEKGKMQPRTTNDTQNVFVCLFFLHLTSVRSSHSILYANMKHIIHFRFSHFSFLWCELRITNLMCKQTARARCKQCIDAYALLRLFGCANIFENIFLWRILASNVDTIYRL